MKKLALLFVSLSALTLAFTACSKKEAPAAETPAPAAESAPAPAADAPATTNAPTPAPAAEGAATNAPASSN